MQRRHTLAALGALMLAGPALVARAQALRSVVVLELELVDDHPNPATLDATRQRLVAGHTQLEAELRSRALYRVVDPAPTQALQRQLREQQEFLYRCDDCTHQVGRLAGADLAMAAWVQKVSELILNFNIEIHDVAKQQVVLSKSVDLRGNNDASWTRAIRFLVRDMAEKRALNPRYGL
jgi:hypothetical protein